MQDAAAEVDNLRDRIEMRSTVFVSRGGAGEFAERLRGEIERDGV